MKAMRDANELSENKRIQVMLFKLFHMSNVVYIYGHKSKSKLAKAIQGHAAEPIKPS